MVNTRYKHFRVTIDQDEQISRNAELAGYKTVSNYLRDVALVSGPHMWEKINRIHDITEKQKENTKVILDAIKSTQGEGNKKADELIKMAETTHDLLKKIFESLQARIGEMKKE